MSLVLKGTTNNDNLYLNNIILIDKDGKETTIDRDNTEWGVQHGVISIELKNLYIWKILKDECNYSKSDINRSFQNAVDFKIEIEDDAPEEYKLDITEIYYNYEVTDELRKKLNNAIKKTIEKQTGISINNDVGFEALHVFSNNMETKLTFLHKILSKENKDEKENNK
jgi:hypothetical protein